MKFNETSLKDAMLIEQQRHADDRGYFARTYCAEEFANAGIEVNYPQDNHSYNKTKGTLRGMHFQRAPHGEAKIVRAVQGGIWDVIIDLRKDSPTYGQWEGFELTAENGRSLYVPVGFAHGFQTLQDDTHILYMISYPFTPGSGDGLRHDDPAFGIDWPLPVKNIAAKDLDWAPFDREKGAGGF